MSRTLQQGPRAGNAGRSRTLPRELVRQVPTAPGAMLPGQCMFAGSVPELAKALVPHMRALAEQEPREVVPRVAGSTTELGAMVGMSRHLMDRAVERGMPHFRIGCRVRVKFADALAWLEQHGHELASAPEGEVSP